MVVDRQLMTPMYGPAARCKRNVGSAGGAAVLHQCIRPRMWSVFRRLRATMGMRAHSISLAVMSRWDNSGHQFRMRREDRSSMLRFILSQTSAGKTSVICLHSSVQFFCSVRVAVPPPRPAGDAGRRARSPASGGWGRIVVHHSRFKSAPRMQNAPGDAGELVGKRDGKLVIVQPAGRSLDPVLEAVKLPVFRPEQHDASGLHEQLSQIAVSASGYATQYRSSAGRGLFRHNAEPGAEVAALGEDITLADACHRRTGDDGADAGNAHQPDGSLVSVRELLDLYRYRLDARIKLPPVARKVLDEMHHAWC